MLPPEIEDFQKWLRRKSPYASTHLHYASDLRLFFAWIEKPPDEIGVRDIDAFIEHFQAEGHAIATINRRLAALRAFYHFLASEAEEGAKQPNPVLPYRHFIRRGERLPRDVQDEQVAQVLAGIRSSRDRAMFLLMLRCGLRVGEVRNLSLPDLYLQPAAGSLPRLWLRGKGNKERVVYLSAQPLAAMQTWLAVRPKSECPAVFLNRFGNRMSVTGIQDRLAGYCRQAGLWLTCHQLRHTFGRHLTEARIPLTSIQRLLGHTWLCSTETYLHASNRQVQADYEAAMQQVVKTLAGAP
jgi:site-specific recombinase XerD